MPRWGELLKELGQFQAPFDQMRNKYIKKLENVTKRNVIVYYSAFLNKNGPVNLFDEDMNGFINAVSGMNTKNGLDLIIHTPGGSSTAAEAIVKYLRSIFNV